MQVQDGSASQTLLQKRAVEALKIKRVQVRERLFPQHRFGVYPDQALVAFYGIDALDIPLQLALWAGEVLIVFSVLASVVSVIVRFWRSRAVERQQLKWFSYAGVVVVMNLLLQGVVLAIVGESDETVNLLNGLFSIAVTSIPITIGIAMLRYKLYDIDRIINRTIVYGGLSVLLAMGYFGAVLLLQGALPVSNDSPVTVAASTLGMVALFRPLRNRIQGVVDRRFNRRRFDAIQTIDDFSTRLRAETNLDRLSTDLVAVVRSTMQPAHVSLWLKVPVICQQSLPSVARGPRSMNSGG
ncbi:MAG TPA: hypothetical protein VFD47_01310 [Actinomycetota bacterium]|nr:hypothetical protein [Actinomycetota bacterium]